MKLVKKIRLAFKEGKSDKIYEVDLVELPGSDPARYLVNFRYGRRGRALREGTKTEQPLTLEAAEAAYQSVVVAKTNDGYYDEAGPAPTPAPHSVAPATSTNDDVQRARRAALLKALQDEVDPSQRGRLIWNLGQGEPVQPASAVAANVNRGTWLEDYAIAWTLGRWRDAAAIPTLEKLRRHNKAVVGDLALEALLLCMTPSNALAQLQAEKLALPSAVLAAIETSNEAEIAQALQALPKDGSPPLHRVLTSCYRLAAFMPALQRALLTFFASCPLVPGVFKAVRHVFKTAELRIDYDMFALLTHRFETTAHFYRSGSSHAFVPGDGYISVAKELGRENSRLAYSLGTRRYLRRRAWRTLFRLGRAESPHYVQLAKAVLLQVSDDDAVQPRTREVFKWTVERGRHRRHQLGTHHYDAYAPFLVFNHILHGADPAYALSPTGAAWHHSPTLVSAKGVQFPSLWDRAPTASLDLLKRSRCSVVHDAALLLLEPQTEFLKTLSSNDVAELLVSSYLQTTQFALTLARALLERGAGDDHLLLALLRSPLAAARELGTQVLAAHPGWATNRPLLIELLLIFAPPTPGMIDAALATSAAALSDADQREIVNSTLGQLLVRNLELTAPAAETLAQILTRHFATAVAALALTLVDRLLSHADLGKQLLGARLLVANQVPFRDIPARLLQHIHSSPHEQVRAISIALLSKQPPDELLQQADMLAELLYRGAAVERRELLTLFTRLAGSGPENEAKVLRALSALLFRADAEPGQGEELYEFFEQHRSTAATAFDKDTVWRLLQAQATLAQRVGAVLLQDRPPTDYTVKQWARLLQHVDLSARTYAAGAFQAHEALVKQHTRDALRLFDSKWDDAREFGFRYFRELYHEDDWSPEYIVAICDNTRHDVQAFGRELLQRFFQEQQGPQYLAALSEHPTINVQLFASNFLEHHASGQRERILALRSYFITVLSQINRARICKDRVLRFLLREALRDAAVADMAAEIFTRVSLTVVRRDRSELIKGLIALQLKYPHLSLPLRPVAVRSGSPRAATAEVSRGV